MIQGVWISAFCASQSQGATSHECIAYLKVSGCCGAVLKLKPGVFVVGFSAEVFRGNVMIHGNVSLIYNEGRIVVESLQNCILFVRKFFAYEQTFADLL